MGREEHCKYCWCVWGVLTVSGPHWVCPNSPWCVLPGSALLRLQVSLQGYCPRQALHFMLFPGLSGSGADSRFSTGAQTQLGMHFVPFTGPSSSGDQVLGESTGPGGPCVLITSPVPAAWVPATRFPGCGARAAFQVCHVPPLESR